MQTTPGRSLATHQRLYRTMLLAYPRAFRQVYGADMVQIFGDRLRDERERRGRRASVGVWFLMLLDLFKTAPLQRMEKKMTREAAFAVVFAVGLAVVVALFVTGTGGAGITMVALGVLILAVIVLALTGSFKSERARGNTPAGKFGPRDWWVVLAGLLGVVEIVMITGQMINDPKWENALALAIVGGLGALALVGTWFRTRSRSTGDWMIVVGVLPFCALFWAIWPPAIALVVMVMALIDSSRGRASQQSATEAPAS